jgi:hypothetical protein
MPESWELGWRIPGCLVNFSVGEQPNMAFSLGYPPDRLHSGVHTLDKNIPHPPLIFRKPCFLDSTEHLHQCARLTQESRVYCRKKGVLRGAIYDFGHLCCRGSHLSIPLIRHRTFFWDLYGGFVRSCRHFHIKLSCILELVVSSNITCQKNHTTKLAEEKYPSELEQTNLHSFLQIIIDLMEM